MHELSIALSLVELAEDEMRTRGLSAVSALHVRVGPLSGVIPRALASAFELAREGTTLAEARLIVEEVPIRIRCERCQAETAVVSPQEMCCVDCGEPGLDVVSGRELDLMAMETT